VTDGVAGQISDGLNGLERTLAPEIAGAAAIGTAAASAFEAWKSQCGDGLCSNLSQFGNIISAIEGVVTDGALIALLVQCVSDPQGAQAAIVSDFEGLATDAADVVTGALNLVTGKAA
jgi:hypothetical protein